MFAAMITSTIKPTAPKILPTSNVFEGSESELDEAAAVAGALVPF